MEHHTVWFLFGVAAIVTVTWFNMAQPSRQSRLFSEAMDARRLEMMKRDGFDI